VRRVRRDFDSCPPAALPGLIERLARRRRNDRLLVAVAAAE
jgi:hypothetical protein